MSDASDGAIVRLQIADYAAVDAAGKLNVIGGGLSIIGQPASGPGVAASGFTAPFAVVVSVAVSPELYGAESAVELVLEDASGQPVSTPTPAGEPQVVRVGQNVTFEEPIVHGLPLPRRALRARNQWVLMFGAGLPLPVGQRYMWRVKIDTASKEEWTEEFFVPGPAPAPVIG